MSPVSRRPDIRPGPPRFVNSGWFTPLLIGLLCIALLAVAWERGRGNFHRLTSAVLSSQPAPERPTGPGGQEAVQLKRTPNAGSGAELVEATLLPGRGMNLLQLTASIPGHGDVPLLMAPPLAEAQNLLTDSGPDTNGALSATMGGALLVPWAGHLTGRPAPSAPNTLQTLWLGQHLTFPAAAPGSSLSTPGLLLDRGADSTHTDIVLDGDSVEAVFHPGTFSGNWPSTGSVHVLVELAGHSMDMTVTVQNTGASPMPVGIGWLPYLAIGSQDRAHATLTLPSSTRLETSRGQAIPTGRTLSTAGTPLDFSRPRGTPLDHTAIDDTFVHLTTPVLTNNPVVELRDTNWGYGIRIIPLTANIKALHVVAPADKPWVAIGPYTNFDDPLGTQWDTSEGSGIRTLQPGDSLQWKVRLEVFTFRAGDTNAGS